jgi:glutaminase
MDYASILLEIQEESNAFPIKGNVTTIPELAKVSPNKFGIHLTTIDGDDFELETVMKISLKYFKSVNRRFGLFFWDERIWERVGVEPSGTAFNSLIQLEHEKGIPRNPFINAGAIVINILVSCLKNPKEDFGFIRLISGSPTIDYNWKWHNLKRHSF